MRQHRNGLQLETHSKLARCLTGLDFDMGHKLWAVVFILALLKTRLDLLHDEVDRDGTLGSQDRNPLIFTSSVKFTTTKPRPVVWVSGNSFPCNTTRTHFLPITMLPHPTKESFTESQELYCAQSPHPTFSTH